MKDSKAAFFTNLPINREAKPLNLIREYNPADYPKYDNYDAINVDRVKDIPFDYKGVMGVPITFFEFYDPDRWQLIGVQNRDRTLKTRVYTIEDSPNYSNLNSGGGYLER